jgi:hypothetical protein
MSFGLRVDARGLGHQADGDVVGATGRAAAPLEAFRVLLEIFHHLLEGLVLRVLADGDGLVLGGQTREWNGLVQLDGRIVGQDGADHDQAHGHDGVAVAAVLDELGQADGSARAAAVEDFDVLSVELLGGQGFLELAGGDVPAAARIGRGHDAEGLGREAADGNGPSRAAGG